MIWLTATVDFLKTPNRAHVVLWVGAGALLLLPEAWLAAMRVDALRDQVAVFVGPLFFLLSALFVAVGAEFSFKRMLASRRKKATREKREAILCDLNPDEAEILRPFIVEQTRGQLLSMESAVVAGLEAHGVILKATGLATSKYNHQKGEAFMVTEYLIQPWAERFLKPRPELLRSADGRSRSGSKGERVPADIAARSLPL